jgi:hypothetical protein
MHSRHHCGVSTLTSLSQSQESQSVDELLDLLSSSSAKSNNGSQLDEGAVTSQESWLLPFVYLLGSQMVIVLVGWLWNKLRRRDKRHKNI